MTIRERWRDVTSRLAQTVFTVTVLTCGGCHPSEPTVGSETHFLVHCDALCPDGTDCLCGVCTKSCASSTECTGMQSSATCAATAPRVAQGRCPAMERAAICDLSCLVDTDCNALGNDFGCQSGYCRASGSKAPAPADAGATNVCKASDIAANEVLVLGDSLIELTPFTSSLEQPATDAGFLVEGQNFRQVASYLMSFMAEGSLSIGAQYSTAREEGAARVVVMDGGETDMFEALCDTEPAYECPTVQDAVRGAQQLFLRMAEDGVEHVVYFFYPDPITDTGLKSRLDVLRPLIENACGQSPVACHWVDLRSLFAGHAEYLGDDGTIFSDAGAGVAANAVWQKLIERCVIVP